MRRHDLEEAREEISRHEMEISRHEIEESRRSSGANHIEVAERYSTG